MPWSLPRTLGVTFNRSQVNIGRASTLRSLFYCLFATRRSMVLLNCSSRTSRSWWITQSTQHHRRGCNSTAVWTSCLRTKYITIIIASKRSLSSVHCSTHLGVGSCSGEWPVWMDQVSHYCITIQWNFQVPKDLCHAWRKIARFYEWQRWTRNGAEESTIFAGAGVKILKKNRILSRSWFFSFHRSQW